MIKHITDENGNIPPISILLIGMDRETNQAYGNKLAKTIAAHDGQTVKVHMENYPIVCSGANRLQQEISLRDKLRTTTFQLTDSCQVICIMRLDPVDTPALTAEASKIPDVLLRVSSKDAAIIQHNKLQPHTRDRLLSLL